MEELDPLVSLYPLHPHLQDNMEVQHSFHLSSASQEPSELKEALWSSTNFSVFLVWVKCSCVVQYGTIYNLHEYMFSEF